MTIKFQGSGSGGSSPPPPPSNPALIFNINTNSQYWLLFI